MNNEKRQKYIKQIAEFPDKLLALVRTVTLYQIDTPYGDGKWTVRQVVHHLADSHIHGFARVKWALTEDNPEVKPYEQDDWAKLSDSELSIESSLLILKGLHQRWVHLFENLSEDEWTRPINHPDPDYSNVEQLLVAYAGHGEKHIGHIRNVMG
ncbi:MAG: putative metal-dependent hydrolase [candidate division Zixibacteria bacterium]|nr:putative metal-dependent hydrolase [candidate division Zixibacteria bacterium]